MAFVISWFEHHSWPWAIIHAVYSWFYVTYYALTKGGYLRPVEPDPLLLGVSIVLMGMVCGVALVRVFHRSQC